MTRSVTVLTGGVGGAKLVLGLAGAIGADRLTAIVNTGDDFVHLGLSISPDIDTLLYTLAGTADITRGWGREGETWTFMAALRTLGGEDWFNLGDGDLALHVLRTSRLHASEKLSAIVADVAQRWGIATRILPMSDAPVATRLDTDEGPLDFQPYFVGRRCEPVVRAISYIGAETAVAAPGVIEAIGAADFVIVAPSNPFLSIAPLLAVPGISDALAATVAPVVAVSPLVGGNAVKGPTAKLMAELGFAVDSATIANLYAPWLDGLLVDVRDPPLVAIEVATARADTMMNTLADRVRVAEAALAFAETLR